MIADQDTNTSNGSPERSKSRPKSQPRMNRPQSVPSINGQAQIDALSAQSLEIRPVVEGETATTLNPRLALRTRMNHTTWHQSNQDARRTRNHARNHEQIEMKPNSLLSSWIHRALCSRP